MLVKNIHFQLCKTVIWSIFSSCGHFMLEGQQLRTSTKRSKIIFGLEQGFSLRETKRKIPNWPGEK